MLKPPPLTVSQVFDNCKALKPPERAMCLNTVMRDYGLQPIHCDRASDMIPRTDDLHATGTPPRGAIVLWSHGSEGDGHVAVSAGQGDCWSVDFGGDGLFQVKVAIASINKVWTDLRYAGWATNYGGVYRLDVPDLAQMAKLPSLRLSRFIESRAEIHQPRDVRQHPLTVATAEHALRKLGFHPGPVDGHYGTGTDAAVKAFQASLDDEPDGKLGPKQWAKLAKLSGLFVPVA
jgi:hypothetical protein